jgi:hypothetical protein
MGNVIIDMCGKRWSRFTPRPGFGRVPVRRRRRLGCGSTDRRHARGCVRRAGAARCRRAGSRVLVMASARTLRNPAV